MKTIKEMHAQWAAKVVPADASQIQRQEMESAFYSGFYSSLNWQLHHLALLSDNQAVYELEARHKESEAYFKTLSQAPMDIFRS